MKATGPIDTADWIAAELDGAGLTVWHMHGAAIQKRTEYPCAGLSELMTRDADVPLILCDLTGKFAPPDPTTVPVSASMWLATVEIMGRSCHVVPSLKHHSDDILMHGQLARLVGMLAAVPDFEGVVCLPGMRSYWAWLSAGEICHFQAYPSGQILHDLGSAALEGPPAEGFGRAVEDALSRPQRAYGKWLMSQGQASAGHVIGLELADAKPYWLGQSVTLMGEGALVQFYAAALQHLGAEVVRAEGEAALLAGLYRGLSALD